MINRTGIHDIIEIILNALNDNRLNRRYFRIDKLLNRINHNIDLRDLADIMCTRGYIKVKHNYFNTYILLDTMGIIYVEEQTEKLGRKLVNEHVIYTIFDEESNFDKNECSEYIHDIIYFFAGDKKDKEILDTMHQIELEISKDVPDFDIIQILTRQLLSNKYKIGPNIKKKLEKLLNLR